MAETVNYWFDLQANIRIRQGGYLHVHTNRWCIDLLS
jgi:hypothetical protein